MRIRFLLFFLLALTRPSGAAAQRYDVSCPTALNRNFFNYQPLTYGGYEWLSQWMAQAPARPLPSRTWYRAYPDRDITSTDGKASWTFAQIRVHCWVYRNMYLTVVHHDPIGYAGSIRALSNDCGDKPPGGQDPISVSSYHPYAPVPSGTAAASCAGAGGGESSGGTTCTSEWMEFVISHDGGQTWEPFWSGWVQSCEAEA